MISTHRKMCLTAGEYRDSQVIGRRCSMCAMTIYSKQAFDVRRMTERVAPLTDFETTENGCMAQFQVNVLTSNRRDTIRRESLKACRELPPGDKTLNCVFPCSISQRPL